jgi:hypothetical protein
MPVGFDCGAKGLAHLVPVEALGDEWVLQNIAGIVKIDETV